MNYSISGTGKIGHLEKSKIRPFPHIVYTHTPARDRNTHSKEIKDQNVKKKLFLIFRKEKYRRIFYTIQIFIKIY